MNVDASCPACRHLLIAFWLGLVLVPRVSSGQADVALQKSVDVAVPSAGQPVQFTVRASNIGSGDALNVLVRDQLPPGLVIPAGAGVFVSAGDYDPATGTWAISRLAAGAEAALVMPAVIAMAAPPACLVNVAENTTQEDADAGNDFASAAVKQDAAVHCVDLAVAFQAIMMVPPVCSTSRAFDFGVDVTNRGPDAARDVIVDLTQAPQLAPGLHFVDSQCTGTRCRFDSIAAGSTRSLHVASAAFQNPQSRQLRFTLSASTSDVDYVTADNQQVVDYVLTPFSLCGAGIDIPSGVTATCFIATAAYGSPSERHVAALREFRDRFLRRSAAGRAFIDWYYEHSPPIARYIAPRPWARSATRALLSPVIAAIVTPWRTIAAALLLILVVVAWRRRVRISG